MPSLWNSEAVKFLGIDESAPLKSLGKFSELFSSTELFSFYEILDIYIMIFHWWTLGDYLYNYAAQNTNINIWYDYMQPANSDVHEILMDIIRDTKRINSLESPR